MLYLDTSLLVSALTREADSDVAQGWLARQDAYDLAISHWVVVEFSTALSSKVRNKQLSRDEKAASLAVFRDLMKSSMTLLPVSLADFEAAVRIADDHASRLRSGDALHLAIASNHDATLCTRDRQFAEGGTAIGLAITLI